ncbi:hypothetical protein ACFW3Z_25570 [Nocardiopsis alba]|uniref:hypothetical protein n=1 Tax=Nocardiopsis alba TaxID=53437 RepID=UPI003672CB10
MTGTGDDEGLSEEEAWGAAAIMARQALYRVYALAEEEQRAVALPPRLSLDLLRAVLTWLVWDQSRRAPREHPGVGPRLASRLPKEIPAAADAYEKWLLEPLLTTPEAADGGLPVEVSVGVRTVALADWTRADAGRARDRDGRPRGTAQVSGLQVRDRETGETTDVVCPMCGETSRIALEFDDYTTWASCPAGHAVWHVPGMGRVEWETWAAEYEGTDRPDGPPF